MPWTFAHPAAVLPLRRVGRIELPLSGLVSGSVVPDVGYYFGPYNMAAFAHTLAGLPLFCLPVGLLFVFFLVRLRSLLVIPLPQPHRTALASLPSPDLRSVTGILLMAVSVLIGATTHIVWDSFTHISGASVHMLSLLQQEAVTILGRTFYGYNVIQHMSTLLGCTVLAVFYRRWVIRTQKEQLRSADKSGRDYLPLVVCVFTSIAFGVIGALFRLSANAPASTIIVRSVIYATVIFGVAYMTLAVYGARKNSA